MPPLSFSLLLHYSLFISSIHLFLKSSTFLTLPSIACKDVNVPHRKASKRVQWDSSSVRALRQHLGATQQELSEELGVRQQTVSEWELGKYQPRGASARILTMVAERASFPYQAAPVQAHEEQDR